MKDFHESMRYEYDLNPFSVVVDLGAYQGHFSKVISDRYHCFVYAFEPVAQFFRELIQTVSDCHKVMVFNFALGADGEHWRKIFIQNDATGFYGVPGESEMVEIKNFSFLFGTLGIGSISLLKINIEGAEFNLLEHILRNGWQNKCQNIQVQFHPIAPGFDKRYLAIREELLKTHRLTFDYPWLWENYKLR